jgi:hypothetical protein
MVDRSEGPKIPTPKTTSQNQDAPGIYGKWAALARDLHSDYADWLIYVDGLPFVRRLPPRGFPVTMPEMTPYRVISVALCVVTLGLAGLLSLAGCGHPTAASPIASAVDSEPAADPSVARVAEGQQAAPADKSNTHAAVTETPPAPPAAGQRPPADRTVTKPGDAEKITWEDVNLGMQADVVFRPFMIDDHRVKDLEGKRISIVGYMHAGQAGQRGIKEFILLKNTQCKFGPGGQADHLADIKLKPDASVPYTPSPIKVEGTLVIEPFQGPDGNTWSIYRLENAQVR